MSTKQRLILILVITLSMGYFLNIYSQNNFPPQLALQLQSEIDNWSTDAQHMGVSAAVILKNGEEWVGTSGISNLDKPLTSEHLIWIASITKTMTGAVILLLAEEKKLDLGDPLSKWLPKMDNVDPSITIKQLLNHTNGLSNYTRSPELSSAVENDSTHIFTPSQLMSFVGPNVFDAGERTQYTNTAFVLLGMIAEKVAKKSIVDLYHEKIWDSLDLSDIFLPGYELSTGPIATSWAGSPRDFSAIEPLDRMSLLSIGNSAFGLFSNAKTIAKWGRALFGDSYLNKSSREKMLNFVPAAGNIPGESGAGLGIRKYNFLNREQYGHSGGSPLGSSLMIYDPTKETTVVVIMNQGRGAQHFILAPKLLEISSR